MEKNNKLIENSIEVLKLALIRDELILIKLAKEYKEGNIKIKSSRLEIEEWQRLSELADMIIQK